MRLILCRHGNTFEADATPVMVGAQEDLPLTATGRAQAAAVGDMLRQLRLVPDLAVTSQLQRTWEYAFLATDGMDVPQRQDPRLSEIDYGPWGGLSEAEVKALSPTAAAELEAWNTAAVFPPTAGWQPDEATLKQQVRSFAAELGMRYKEPDKTVLVVSSNGVMRYFLNLIPGAWDAHIAARTFKVKTGHVCVLEHGLRDGLLGWHLLAWNVAPEAAAEHLR